ncbi:uncharacterized protein LOC119530201 [Choloepus didactylus]|uniref:uncharacterized protein LOC119530201 n=1 Tax=Choloepus didactylus TaxID=27675 RepID=UPI00189D0BED|nr:uncharacterized protein LOC119530201 [Choloepus didactylus]
MEGRGGGGLSGARARGGARAPGRAEGGRGRAARLLGSRQRREKRRGRLRRRAPDRELERRVHAHEGEQARAVSGQPPLPARDPRQAGPGSHALLPRLRGPASSCPLSPALGHVRPDSADPGFPGQGWLEREKGPGAGPGAAPGLRRLRVTCSAPTGVEIWAPGSAAVPDLSRVSRPAGPWGSARGSLRRSGLCLLCRPLSGSPHTFSASRSRLGSFLSALKSASAGLFPFLASRAGALSSTFLQPRGGRVFCRVNMKPWSPVCIPNIFTSVTGNKVSGT